MSVSQTWDTTNLLRKIPRSRELLVIRLSMAFWTVCKRERYKKALAPILKEVSSTVLTLTKTIGVSGSDADARMSNSTIVAFNGSGI